MILCIVLARSWPSFGPGRSPPRGPGADAAASRSPPPRRGGRFAGGFTRLPTRAPRARECVCVRALVDMHSLAYQQAVHINVFRACARFTYARARARACVCARAWWTTRRSKAVSDAGNATASAAPASAAYAACAPTRGREVRACIRLTAHVYQVKRARVLG